MFNPEHLIQALYHSVAAPHAWHQMLLRVTDMLHADHLLLGQAKGRHGVHLIGARVDNAHIGSVVDSWRGSPLQALVGSGPAGQVFPDGAAMDRRALIRSDYFQQVIRPMGGHYALIGLPYRDRVGGSLVAACRSQGRGAFGNQSQAHLQQLLPHLATAMQLRERLSSTDPQNLLERCDRGVVLFDHQLHILAMNQRAQRLLAQDDGLSIEGHRLTTISSASQRLLKSSLTSAAQGTELVTAKLSLRVSRPSGLPPFTLRIQPLSHDSEWRLIPDTAVILWLDAADDYRIDHSLLAELFDFTPRETDLALLLIDGHELKRCAELMSVGLETARTHLDALFAKTGTRRQAQLVSVLLRSAWRL